MPELSLSFVFCVLDVSVSFGYPRLPICSHTIQFESRQKAMCTCCTFQIILRHFISTDHTVHGKPSKALWCHLRYLYRTFYHPGYSLWSRWDRGDPFELL